MVDIVAAHKYEGKYIKVSRRIKNPTDDAALQEAAEDMARLVPEGSTLIPAPSSSGLNRSMFVLAMNISSLVQNTEVVEAVVRSTPVESSHLRRRSGRRGLSVEEHVRSMSVVESIPTDRLAVIIDNVSTEGHTIEAVSIVLGVPVLGVVYADAKSGRGVTRLGSVPSKKLRICVAGSRGFRSLEKVDLIVSTLPDGTTVVHGGARGVDQRAGEAAQDRGLSVEIFKPDWETHGRSAGPIRNVAMVRTCDYLIAFWDSKSRGTASSIQAAIDNEIDFEVILDD